jgi:hypothetical protein
MKTAGRPRTTATGGVLASQGERTARREYRGGKPKLAHRTALLRRSVLFAAVCAPDRRLGSCPPWNAVASTAVPLEVVSRRSWRSGA